MIAQLMIARKIIAKTMKARATIAQTMIAQTMNAQTKLDQHTVWSPILSTLILLWRVLIPHQSHFNLTAIPKKAEEEDE